MGIAASVAVAIAVLVALTLTPALLGFVKGRVVGRPQRARRARDRRAATRTLRRRLAADAPPRRSADSRSDGSALVTRHPVVTTVAVVAGLGILAIPAASLALALPNAGMLPEENEARQSYDLVAEHFGPGFNGPSS